MATRYRFQVEEFDRAFPGVPHVELLRGEVLPDEPHRTSEPEPDLLVLTPPLERYQDRLPTPEDVLLLVEVADPSRR